jgi:ATP-binding protein involved in chromosome partitioning
VALADARRAHTLFQRVNVPTLGLIENMSGDVFGRGGAAAEAERLEIAFLGDLPLDAAVRQAGDAGAPLSTGDLATRFDAIATALAGQLGL